MQSIEEIRQSWRRIGEWCDTDGYRVDAFASEAPYCDKYAPGCVCIVEANGKSMLVSGTEICDPSPAAVTRCKVKRNHYLWIGGYQPIRIGARSLITDAQRIEAHIKANWKTALESARDELLRGKIEMLVTLILPRRTAGVTTTLAVLTSISITVCTGTHTIL